MLSSVEFALGDGVKTLSISQPDESCLTAPIIVALVTWIASSSSASLFPEILFFLLSPLPSLIILSLSLTGSSFPVYVINVLVHFYVSI